MDYSPYYLWCVTSAIFWLSLIRSIHDYRHGRGPKPLALIVAAIGIAPAHILVAGYGWFVVGGRSVALGDAGALLFLFGVWGFLLGTPATILAATLPPWEPDARTIWAGKLAALAFMFVGWFAGGAMR